MKFETAIDLYIADMWTQARMTSPSSEVGYRSTLMAHAEDIQNRDPAYVSREDVKRTLRRWPHPNTQGTNRSKLVSFYDWTMEEGMRKDNPALQTRRPRRRAKDKYRLTEAEAARCYGRLRVSASVARSSLACVPGYGTPSFVVCKAGTSRETASYGCLPISPRVAVSVGCL